MEHIKSGIPGLDEMLNGGFPKGRAILVSGACGTGKTILSMQFIYNGIMNYAEPGVYVTFDEIPEKIRQDMQAFGWDLKELEKNKLMALVDATSAHIGQTSDEEHALTPAQLDLDRLLIEILKVVNQIGAKRLVIDSIPAMAFQLDKQEEIRRAILKMVYVLSKKELTTIMTSEIPEQSSGLGLPQQFSKFEVEEYVADGVVVMSFLGTGSSATRTIYVRKMRGTKHDADIHPLEITPQGMVVKKIEDVFK